GYCIIDGRFFFMSGYRKIQSKSSSMPRFAVDVNKPVVAFDDAVNDCEAQSTAVANAFGREKRLEDSRPNPLTHSYTLCTKRHAQIPFCRRIRIRHLRTCNDHGL